MARTEGAAEFELYLSHVNKLVKRRQDVTQTYISVNAALTGAVAFLLSGSSTNNGLSTVVLLCAGVIAAAFWRRIIGQYHTLLDWWYEQLRILEAAHPGTSKLVTKEYEELYVARQGNTRRGRITLGLADYEVALTWLFTAIYAIVALVIVAAFIFSQVIKHT